MHVRVRGLVEIAHRIQHLARLLGARRRVEEREWLAVDQLLEDREVGAHLLRVELPACRHGHSAILALRLRPTPAFRRPSAYPLDMRRSAFALLAGVVVLAGCGGGGGNSSSSKGAKVFASAGCGGCHTLSAAKSNGQTGPNLDQLKPSYDAVVHQVSSGGAGMPSFTGKLSKGQIRDVASYVVDSTKNNSAALTAFEPNDEKVSDCHG